MLDLKLEDEPYEIKIEDINAEDINVNDIEEDKDLKKDNHFSLKDREEISKQSKIAIAGAIVTFLASFLNFWGMKEDGLGKLNYGNFFNGFATGRVLGLFFILAIIATCGFLYFNIFKFAFIAELVEFVAFLTQVIIIIIWGKGSLGGGQHSSLYFGIGFYFCLLGIAATAYFTYISYKKNKLINIL